MAKIETLLTEDNAIYAVPNVSKIYRMLILPFIENTVAVDKKLNEKRQKKSLTQ